MEFGVVNGIPSKSSGSSGSNNNLTGSIVSVPTNHSIWLLDYKTYGENSYVFQDKDIWDELMNSRVAVNDKDVVATVRKYFTDTGKDPLKMLCNMYGVNIDVQDGQTFADVISITENAEKIVNHDLAFEFVRTYPQYLTEFLSTNERADLMMAGSSFKKYLATVQQTTESSSYANTVVLTTASGVYCYLEEMQVSGKNKESSSVGYANGCQSGAWYARCSGDVVYVASTVMDNSSFSSAVNKTVHPNVIVKSASIQSARRTGAYSAGGQSGTIDDSCISTMKYRKLFV